MRKRSGFLLSTLLAMSAAGCGGEDDNAVVSTPKPVAIADLRADVNRNGTVDLDDSSEDDRENTWDKDHGAIFLANIDDDAKTCPKSGPNAALAGCNDAFDDIINGPDDLEDLARLKTAAWPEAPKDAYATIALSMPGVEHVRLFKWNGSEFQVFDTASGQLGPEELVTGVEFAIEGKDILRDTTIWDGLIDVTLKVHGGTGTDGKPIPDAEDTVRMRLAPIIFRHHLDPAEKVYATKFTNDADSSAFMADLGKAVQASGIEAPLVALSVGDQWTQDFFETTYMSMPAEGEKQHVIHVNLRSANFESGLLRAAGKVVFTQFRGKDVAGAVQYDPMHPDEMDSLNSFGNTETIPPHSFDGEDYPLGRVLRGSNPQYYPDKSFDRMIAAQGVQPMVTIDTEWLYVGHVDETVSFIKADTPRGWAMLINDATLAKKMLQDAVDAGQGESPMFVGMKWYDYSDAQATISEVLNDPEVMNTSAWAAAEVDSQLTQIESETGITEADLVKVPFLHQPEYGYAVAYNPGTVNGIYLSDQDFGAPDPHGPVVNGQDIFKKQLEEALAPFGVKVHWIENWNLYHALDGEVHCGSNVTRAIPTDAAWWESGR